MPKFFVTCPALSGKYFEVEAPNSLWATYYAFRHTVWAEEDWQKNQQRLKDIGYYDEIFPTPIRINVMGQPWKEGDE